MTIDAQSVLAPGDAPRDCSPAELVQRAERLAQRSGGPAVRAVIYIRAQAAGDPEPRVLARYPRLVAQMSRAQALAYSADRSWNRFLVVETAEGRPSLSVMTRAGTGFSEQPIRSSGPAQLEAALACLGVQHCVLAGASDAIPLNETLVTARAAENALFEGALAFASETLAAHGISVEKQRTAVCASRAVAYSVLHPERHVFDPLDGTLAELAGARPLFFVFDKRVGELYRHRWQAYTRHHHLASMGELAFDSSERSKSWRQVDAICAAAAKAGLPRDAILVGIGGGITLDVAGLAASLFRRGIDYVRIPTTLVGLVDVSVGIKQGVNAYGRKNMIGAFYPPLASINDYRFLHSLPEREIACGAAEIVKMAALRDPALFGMLERHARELQITRFATPAAVASEVTRRAELLMLEELAPNLFEDERARLVDFGHTFSPAIEVASHFEIPHGCAVAFDMLISTALAVALGWSDPAWLERLAGLFDDWALPLWDERVPAADELLAALADVRRHRGGALNLVVVSEPGVTHFVAAVSREQMAAARELVTQVAAARAQADATGAKPLVAVNGQEGSYARAAV